MQNHTDLLAQIRAASSASELSCSYSLETRWMQRGNSSTFARFCKGCQSIVSQMHPSVGEYRTSYTAKVEDPNLGVGNTTVEPGLGVWLSNLNVSPLFYSFFPFHRSGIVAGLCLTLDEDVQRSPQSTASTQKSRTTYLVLAIAVASRWTTSHFEGVSRLRGYRSCDGELKLRGLFQWF